MREYSAGKARVRPYAARNLRCRRAVAGPSLSIGRPLSCRVTISKQLNSGGMCNMVNAVMSAQSDPRLGPFERFLLWLSPHRDVALKKHDDLMKKMRKYFVRKGCPESEELASEVRDRVVKIIDAGQDYPNHDALFYSVAAKVWKEYLRKPKPEPLPAESVIRQYLLGRLDDQDKLESSLSEQMLFDEELSETVDSIEDELIEDYLDGALNDADRKAAEEYFLRPPERKEKLRFARLLRSRFEKKQAAVTKKTLDVAHEPVRKLTNGGSGRLRALHWLSP